MSRSLNKAMLIGNLGSDPEIRSTTTGARVASFSLATSRSWTGQNGEKQEKTEWHKCVVWNTKSGSGLVDVIEKYVKKGDRLYVEGEIEYRQYQDKEGQTKYSTEITCRELILLGGRGGPDDEGGGSWSGSRGSGAARSAAPAAGAAKKSESFDDFPDALDGADDDLPF